MDPQKYLHRIGYVQPDVPVPTAKLDVLRRAHRCHLTTVPFENLTVHSGGRVRLELPLLYDKIVNQRRGGFCYENNGLFSWLLLNMGFEVTLLSGQVRNSITRRYGPPFDHLITMVTLEGQRWLCDVGFGGAGFELPVSLETDGPQTQGHQVYRVRKEKNLHYLEWQDEEDRAGEGGGSWTEIYKFTLDPRRREDFTEMCDYHQSSPCSIFFCKSLCSILRPSGRLTYIGHKLVTTTFPSEAGENVTKTTRELRDEEIPHVLKDYFGIVLGSPLIPKDEDVIPPPQIMR